MIIKALLDVSIEGLGTNGRTSIFPCGIFQYMKGVNDKPGTPNYDMYQLALRSTAQRLYPNYANCDWTAQNNWCEKDRKDKQQYIDALNDTDKNNLIEKLEKYPELCDILGIDITNK